MTCETLRSRSSSEDYPRGILTRANPQQPEATQKVRAMPPTRLSSTSHSITTAPDEDRMAHSVKVRAPPLDIPR